MSSHLWLLSAICTISLKSVYQEVRMDLSSRLAGVMLHGLSSNDRLNESPQSPQL